MQSNIFLKALPTLKEKKYDEFIEFLGKYKSGDWIYPAVIHRKLGIDLKLIYEALEICCDLGLVEQYLEIYCQSCKKFTGLYFKTISEIPDSVYCLHCDDQTEKPMEHAIVIYKVLKNE
jgi:hypothetical protein